MCVLVADPGKDHKAGRVLSLVLVLALVLALVLVLVLVLILADMIFVKKITRPQFWEQELYAKNA